ncbi:MAG: ATP-dependent helicase, partial [Treponema sp.]|nr:ATP-dependent helicase [Treponema sp.]
IGNVDFGDLIKKPVEILRAQPEVARRFHDRFKVIMVDEYQDANVAQFHLLKELCGPETYVCVVGDDDQSIYRFRGAEVKNILEFPERFSGADIIRLEQNYRSTSPILSVATSVVDCNRGRLGKKLRAERGNGTLPSLVHLPDQDEEAAFCADRIESAVKKGGAWSDWAILYRTNAQSLAFETLFLRRGIPYRVVGSLKFYEREEIKDALALLAILVNPRDEVAFRRVVNKPARGIGAVSIDKIVEASYNHGGNLLEAGVNLDLSQKARAGLNQFIDVINDGQEMLSHIEDMRHIENAQHIEGASIKDVDTEKKSKAKKTGKKKREGLISGEGLSHCVARLILKSGIAEYHEMQDEVQGSSKLGNLQELINAASEYQQSREGLLEFLEDIELDRSIESGKNEGGSKTGDPQNAVTLITFHNTKGLEFKRVIMTGLEQGIFPREDKKGEELEEERRLFYVGATRAMDELFFTTCAVRRMYGRTMPAQPSLFLNEIDKKSLQIFKGVGSRGATGIGIQQHSFGNPPARSFNQFNLNAGITRGSATDNAAKNNEVEERAGYKRGQRILHDDHGFGAVMDVRDSEEGPVVRVRFESGIEKRFLSEYQGRAYEKIGEDV